MTTPDEQYYELVVKNPGNQEDFKNLIASLADLENEQRMLEHEKTLFSSTFNVFDSFGKNAFNLEHAKIVFEFLDKHLSNKTPVTISFENVKLVTNEFLVMAIGQAYFKYPQEYLDGVIKDGQLIDGLLNIIGLNSTDCKLLQNVIKEAIKKKN